jgi:exopolyphosphatase / guanosine-5'-triphosphate,3'-diphosphate pyrophosphatase
MRRRTKEIIAAIDVGSNSIKMIIAEVNRLNEITVLEDLKQNTDLGRDTFSFGRISPTTINETCETLDGFAKILEEYQVRDYLTFTTSGIRESENKEYVIEQIRAKTGFDVNVISNSEEHYYLYKVLRQKYSEQNTISDEKTMYLNVGAGGVEITVYNGEELLLNQYIKIGALRVREVLSELENVSLDFSNVMEEFIESKIYNIKCFLETANIKKFIGMGRDIIFAGQPLDSLNGFVTKKQLDNFYNLISEVSCDRISEEYQIPHDEADLMLPSIIIFRTFMHLTKAEVMYVPVVSLADGMIIDMIENKYITKRKRVISKDILNSVFYVAQKYQTDLIHAAQIKTFALLLFDKLAIVHMLGEKERFYIEVASLLHDVGYFISSNQHDIHSYSIILNEDFIGFSEQDLILIANICRYHGDEIPMQSDENYRMLTFKEKIIVSKLSAILKIAEALDITHKQKISKLTITIDKLNVYFKFKSNKEILLEKWAFKKNAAFFQDVMGLKPILMIKGD